MNTLSLGCSTTKTHAEQRHFHHVSHSSWLTGTVKSSLIPPLCAGAHTQRRQQLRAGLPGMVGVLTGYSTYGSSGHHGYAPQNSQAMGRPEFALMLRSPRRQAGGTGRVGQGDAARRASHRLWEPFPPASKDMVFSIPHTRVASQTSWE